MIDTIGFRIDLCTSSDADKISQKLRVLTDTNGETGEIISSFTRGSLSGSWDSRISLSICDREWLWVEDENALKGGRTLQVSCLPYLRCEFSLQKWIYGVNCFSYDYEVAIEGIYHFSLWLQEQLAVVLPAVEVWRVIRLDVGRCFSFGDDITMLQYLDHLKRVEFPRRKLRTVVYQTSVMWVGAGQCFKLYGKRAEFKKHDKNRLASVFGQKDTGNFFDNCLDGVLRAEISLQKRVLETHGIFRVYDLFDNEKCINLLVKNMESIGIKKDCARIWSAGEVRALLQDVVAPGSGVSPEVVYAVWVDSVISGRNIARSRAGENKYYRATRILKNFGISFVTNLVEVEKIPAPVDLVEYRDKKIHAFLLRQEQQNPLAIHYFLAA